MVIYFGLNNFWIWFNLFAIATFFIAFLNRLKNPSFETQLKTDYLSRFGLVVTLVFYLVDTITKSVVDGTESICQKAIIMHHIVSFFIMGPLILNSYVPWWVHPVGFVHGWIVYFDDHVWVQYFYGSVLLLFHYMLYRKPYRDFKYYWITKIAINYVWTFILFYRLGECSNYLPTEPDNIILEEAYIL